MMMMITTETVEELRQQINKRQNMNSTAYRCICGVDERIKGKKC
jgi:hypothetical protein